MPYFNNDDINLLFIHIPKTGGTSLEIYFSSKFNIKLNEKSLFNVYPNKNTLTSNTNSSLQHLTYNQIIKNEKVLNIDFNNIKIITIVRNPYERIISDLFWYKLIDSNTSKDKVFNIINNYLISNKYDNHNIPQHHFITDVNKVLIPNIHILKTENLTNNMINLGYTDFNNLNNKNKHKLNYYNYLNEKSIELINYFYNLDFILFNYKKINISKNIIKNKMIHRNRTIYRNRIINRNRILKKIIFL
jgi:hypothetical protein